MMTIGNGSWSPSDELSVSHRYRPKETMALHVQDKWYWHSHKYGAFVAYPISKADSLDHDIPMKNN